MIWGWGCLCGAMSHRAGTAGQGTMGTTWGQTATGRAAQTATLRGAAGEISISLNGITRQNTESGDVELLEKAAEVAAYTLAGAALEVEADNEREEVDIGTFVRVLLRLVALLGAHHNDKVKEHGLKVVQLLSVVLWVGRTRSSSYHTNSKESQEIYREVVRVQGEGVLFATLEPLLSYVPFESSAHTATSNANSENDPDAPQYTKEEKEAHAQENRTRTNAQLQLLQGAWTTAVLLALCMHYESGSLQEVEDGIVRADDGSLDVRFTRASGERCSTVTAVFTLDLNIQDRSSTVFLTGPRGVDRGRQLANTLMRLLVLVPPVSSMPPSGESAHEVLYGTAVPLICSLRGVMAAETSSALVANISNVLSDLQSLTSSNTSNGSSGKVEEVVKAALKSLSALVGAVGPRSADPEYLGAVGAALLTAFNVKPERGPEVQSVLATLRASGPTGTLCADAFDTYHTIP